jgi:hypothetical protein
VWCVLASVGFVALAVALLVVSFYFAGRVNSNYKGFVAIHARTDQQHRW